MTRTIDIESLELLRMIFDLAEADVRPTLDLLVRLLDIDANRAVARIAGLRRTGLVQMQNLGLTMGGLAIAASLSPTELAPMQVTVTATAPATTAAPVRKLRVA